MSYVFLLISIEFLLIDSASLRKVVGMNTVIYSPSGASAGVGFAIPSDTVGVYQLSE